MNHPKKSLLVLSFTITLIAGLWGGIQIIDAIDTESTGYKILVSSYADITPSHSTDTYKRITNNSDTNQYFVPTKTAAEWAAFLANIPSDLVATALNTISSVVLSAATANNYDADDLTVVITASLTTTEITDWRIGGTSMAVLNAPMDSNANDYSTNTNNGTVNGATFTTTGCKLGGCYSFDGTNDSVDIAHSTSLAMAGDITVSAWLYPDAFTNTPMVVSYNNDSYTNTFLTGFDPSGYVAFWTTSGSVASAYTISTATWTHVSWVFDNTADTVSYYINGVYQDNDAVTDTVSYSNGTWHIGAECDSAGCPDGNYWDGKMDEVLVFDRALSAAQITDIYNSAGSGTQLETIDDAETEVSESWTVNVTPNNGTEDGTAVLSNAIVVVDECSGTGTMPSIGDTCVGGGKYAGTFNGYHLIFNTNSSGNIAWANNSGTTAYGVATGASSTTDGPSNTDLLATTYTDTDAAKYCYNLTSQGYTDWFSPPKDALSILWTYRTELGAVEANYWGSTEDGTTTAWKIDTRAAYGAGSISSYNKTNGSYSYCFRQYAE
jgi:hypothetical protein